MTREDAIKCLKVELHIWESDCKSKHAVKDALKMAITALEQEPNTWSLNDAREDFTYDVYNTLDFLPTNNEANRIIDSFDRVTSSIKQEPVLDKIRAEIEQEPYISKMEVLDILDKYKAESENKR